MTSAIVPAATATPTVLNAFPDDMDKTLALAKPARANIGRDNGGWSGPGLL